MDQQELKIVGKGVRKKDAMALLLGKPAYVDDVTPRNCLVVKVLRSPHAHALIEEIDTENAESIPGVAAIFTYKDVPQKRFTMDRPIQSPPPTTVSFWTGECALWETLWPSWPGRTKGRWTGR